MSERVSVPCGVQMECEALKNDKCARSATSRRMSFQANENVKCIITCWVKWKGLFLQGASVDTTPPTGNIAAGVRVALGLFNHYYYY